MSFKCLSANLKCLSNHIEKKQTIGAIIYLFKFGLKYNDFREAEQKRHRRDTLDNYML